MSEGGDLPRPPEISQPQTTPVAPEAQANGGLRDRLASLGKRAIDVLVPKDRPLTPEEITMPTFAGLILGGGGASETSPGLTQGQIDELIGYHRIPEHGTKAYGVYLESTAVARRLMGNLLTDGTMRIVPEKQPSGQIITTYALANKGQLETHAHPKPVIQAHPR